MKFTNRANLPPHIATVLEAAYRRTVYDGPKSGRSISVSQLIGPAQALQLCREHEADLSMDIMDTVPALFGSAIHHLLDVAGESAPALVREERLTAQYGGWTISGKPDVYVTGDGLLVDYKSSSVWTYIFGKPEWIAQLNIYKWLLELHGSAVKEMEVDLFCKDWRRGESRQSPDYPAPVQPIPIPAWPLEQTLAFLDERLMKHEQTLPACSAEERWERVSVWANKKPANKRARAVYADNQAATADLKAGEVTEFRQGESVRCSSWCLAAPFCKQWAANPTNPANRKEEEE